MTTSTQSTAVKPDFNAINTWTSNDYALLTADLVRSMTLTQIQAMLHPDQVPPAAVSGFTPEQISCISVNYYPSAAWINALSIPALQAMSPSAFYHVIRPQLAGVDNAHFSALTAGQVAGTNKLDALSSAQFGLLNLTGMSASQIAALTANEFTGLTATQIGSLSPAQVAAISYPGNLSLSAVSGFTANQMAALNVDFSILSADWLNSLSPGALSGLTATQAAAISVNFSSFSDSWLNALNTDAFRGLTTSQLSQLNTVVLCGLDNAHLSALTPAQVAGLSGLSALSSAQFGLLNLTGMSPSQIAGLNTTEYAGLTGAQISSLSSTQVAALSAPVNLTLAAVSGLTASQISAISVNFSSLSAGWLNSLTTSAIQGMTAAQAGQLSKTTLIGLDNTHLSVLSATQVAALTSITSLSNAQFGLLTLSEVPASTMAKWSKSTWAGLTAAQVSSFSNAQIDSFQSASWLPVSAASGLLPSQMASLTSSYSQFSADWLNHLQLASFQALDNGRLGQISAATWAQIDVAHFSALNATQIAVIKLDFSTVSADWLNSLSPATLQGLTTTQLGHLSAGVIAGLSDTSLSAFTVSQLAALPDLTQLSGHQFSLLNLSAMSNAQIAAWTPDQYATLTAAEFSTLSTAQIGAMTNPAALPLAVVSTLTVAQVNAINTDFSRLPDNWLNSLSTTALQGLTPYQFSHLSSLTPAEVNNITSLAALSTAQFSQLNLTGLSRAQISTWGRNECAGLTAQQITSLSADQINAIQHPDWMPAAAAAGFTAEKIARMSVSVYWFSTDWLNTLSVDTFRNMAITNLNQITASKLSGVDDAHLSALDAGKVALMTNLGTLASSKFSVLNISSFSASQLTALTLSQCQGLTQAQMSSLSANQIQALAHPEWLAPGLINNLSLTQVSSMTSDQITSMSIGAIASLDAAHLAVWPGDVTAFTPEELLAVGSRLTNAQINSLTDSQRSMLATSDNTAQALINSLSDASLKSIMLSVESNSGTLFSFGAIESVMKNLDAGMGDMLSASQYSDLNRYLQDIGSVRGTDSSVYSLVNGMVTGANGASVDWTSPTDGTFTRIGNLNIGSSTTQFDQLIDNWFDGTNEPPSSSTKNVQNRPLFVNGTPSINDIHQGYIGDCIFLAALQTIVSTHPDYIKSMIVENPNDTYSVKFFNNDAPVWVTVDKTAYSSGANSATSSWGAIMEHAVVNYLSTYSGYTNSYLGIYAGIKNMTGDAIVAFSPHNYTVDGWNTTVFDTIKSAVLAGDPTEINCWVNTTDAINGNQDFVSGHAFSVNGFDAATNKFIISNPWGASNTSGWNGTFEASMDEIRGGGSNSIYFGDAANATGAAGQLVSAMATMTPTSSASSSMAVSQPAASNTSLLVTAHV